MNRHRIIGIVFSLVLILIFLAALLIRGYRNSQPNPAVGQAIAEAKKVAAEKREEAKKLDEERTKLLAKSALKTPPVPQQKISQAEQALRVAEDQIRKGGKVEFHLASNGETTMKVETPPSQEEAWKKKADLRASKEKAEELQNDIDYIENQIRQRREGIKTCTRVARESSSYARHSAEIDRAWNERELARLEKELQKKKTELAKASST